MSDDRTTYGEELNNYLSNIPQYQGFILGDGKLKQLEDGDSYLINIGNKNIGGTHWTALYIDGDYALYFDSAALAPNQNIINQLKQQGLKILTNIAPYQSYLDVNDNSCGQRASRMIRTLSTAVAPAQTFVELFGE